jgi:drug/metabolite transporter (DMT)-like permease
MDATSRSALTFGVLTALFWGPNFHTVQSLAGAGVPSFTVCFHLLLWPALLCFALLLISGRWPEVAVFRRRETQILLLAAAGGFGFWALRAAALEASAAGPAEIWVYTAPLLMWVLSLAGRERGTGRALLGLVFGLAGCVLLLSAGPEGGGVPARARLFGVGAAACWAGFSIMLRQAGREVRTLPLVFLITVIGAVCMGVTCLSTGDGLFNLKMAAVRRTALAGLLTVGVMMALWIVCLRSAQVWRAGTLWFLGALSAVLWGRVQGVPLQFWPLLGGTALVLMGIWVGFPGRQSGRNVTLGDIIRG